MEGAPLMLQFFFETPPHQNQSPVGVHPPLKNEAPPFKPKTPFHEMIPRKSTIKNNLKSS